MLCVVLSILMVFTCTSVAFADDNGEEREEYTYNISSPYDGIDWDNINQYKADLHSHTDASDADQTIEENVKSHYDLGYQILAISDHAVVGVPWDEVPQTVPIYRFFKFLHTVFKCSFLRHTKFSL